MIDSGFKIEIVGHEEKNPTYFIDFEYEPQSEDGVFFSHSIPLFIPQSSQAELAHCVIDFIEEGDAQGFKVLTPAELRKDHGCL